jgi:glutamate carboxypeptidase
VTGPRGAELPELALVRDLLERLVRVESPSQDPEAVGRALDLYARALEEVGAELRAGGRGEAETLVAEVAGFRQAGVPGARGGDDATGGIRRPFLVVGHLDTVHPVGTLAGPLPLREEDGRLYGPGVYDMKAGLAVLVGALALLRRTGRTPAHPLRILVTPDEEVGAPSSRRLLEAQAREAAGALVLEPPLPGGGGKIRRKGVGEFRIHVHGAPAHAGIEPERGASAIHALGRVLPALLALADPEAGITLNVGRVQGGGPVNVVAARVELTVDVRVSTAQEKARIEAGVRALGEPWGVGLHDSRIRIQVEGGVDRPPMEPGEGAWALLARAREIARELGRPAWDAGATGGGSDGNLLSAAGCPVLDGLGVEGDGAHTFEEHILLEDLPWRIRFLAELLAGLEDPSLS